MREAGERKLSNVCISLLFAEADGPCKPVPAEENVPLHDGAFKREYADIEYTLINVTMEKQWRLFLIRQR